MVACSSATTVSSSAMRSIRRRAPTRPTGFLRPFPVLPTTTRSGSRPAKGARRLVPISIGPDRSTVGVTPDMLEALSWLARGTLDDKQYDRADAYANETRQIGRASYRERA